MEIYYHVFSTHVQIIIVFTPYVYTPNVHEKYRWNSSKTHPESFYGLDNILIEVFHQHCIICLSIRYSGYAWLPLINGGGSWLLLSIVDLSVREDTMSINSSPMTATPPIVRFKFGCSNTLVIPSKNLDLTFSSNCWIFSF